MNKLTTGLLTIALIMGIFFLGCYTEKKLYPSKTIFLASPPVVKVVEKDVEVEVEKRVFVPVEKLVIKQVPVPIKIRPFYSLDELEMWIEGCKPGVIIRSGELLSKIVCEDFAFAMVRRAIEDGYFLTTEKIRYKGYYHMVAAAPIGNSLYYIEATPDSIREYKEIWFGYNLDKPD